MVSLYCGIFKRCQNVVFFEERIVLKNFLVRRAGAKQAQNIGDTNAQATNTGASAAFADFDSDPLEQTGFRDSSKAVKSYLPV